MPQIVAVEQRNLGARAAHALAQDGCQRGVDRAARLALLRRCDIGRQVRKAQIKTIPGIEIVSGLRHGERDDARRGISPDRDQTCQARLKRDDSLDGRDFGVASGPRGRNGLQRVCAALGREVGHQLHHVRPRVASGQHPPVVSRFDEPMQVKRLMRAMKEAEPQMEHHERGRHGQCLAGNQRADGATTRPCESNKWAAVASIWTPTVSPTCGRFWVLFLRATSWVPRTVLT